MSEPSARDADRSLALAIAGGDRDAFAVVFERHRGASHALARRLVRDDQRAEDIVQDVFERLWTRASRYDAARGSLRSFLMAHTESRALDLLRSERARHRREQRDADHVPRTAEVEHQAVARTVADDVRRALATLDADERAAVELAYLGDLPYRAVAERLGIPEGTAKSRIRRGLTNLRRALAESAAAERER